VFLREALATCISRVWKNEGKSAYNYSKYRFPSLHNTTIVYDHAARVLGMKLQDQKLQLASLA
jgi:hypothetical protein